MDEPKAQTPDEATFNENVKEVLHGLPQPIQDFLTGPERDEVTLRLTTRHNLHADQAGRFQKAFLFMLMGIFSPEQFAKDLADIGIPPETVRSLANDVNEEVFKPLRAKEQQGGEQSIVTASPATIPIPVPPSPIPAPPAQPPTPRPVIPAPIYVPIQQQPISLGQEAFKASPAATYANPPKSPEGIVSTDPELASEIVRKADMLSLRSALSVAVTQTQIGEGVLVGALRSVLSPLPPAIKTFVMGAKRDESALKLVQKYTLSPAQSGVFELGFLRMLLGISSPEDFVHALREGGISEEILRALVFDVNEEVFRPLSTGIQKESEPSSMPAPANVPAPAIVIVPPPIPPSLPQPPHVTPPTPALVVPASVIYDSTPQSATIRTMALDMQAVNEHKTPEAIVYQPSTPMPARAPEPPPISIALPVQPPQNTAVQRTDPVRAPSNLPGQAPPPLIKEYSADPYRETI